MKSVDWTTSEIFVAGKSPSAIILASHLKTLPECLGHIFISTSGSREQKWVGVSKKAMLISADGVNRFLNVKKNDIWFQALPSHHVGGLSIEARAFLTGSQVYQWHALNPKWIVENFYQALNHSNATLTSLVPTQVFDIVKCGLKSPSRLRAVVVGGDWLPENLYHKARALKWPLLPSFGMSETGSQIATAPLTSLSNSEYPALETLSHVQLKTDPDKRLCIKSSALFSYYVVDDKMKANLQYPDFKDGWFKSEDTASLEHNKVIPLGRIGDIYKVGGELVSGQTLDHIFNEMLTEVCLSETVIDACIAMKKEERLGHQVELFVAKSQDVTEKEIQNLVQRFDTSVRPFEKIRKINYVSEIPRSDLGKVLKNLL